MTDVSLVLSSLLTNITGLSLTLCVNVGLLDVTER